MSRWHGELQGGAYGADLSLIFFQSHEVGAGPRLHQHPYLETFIVRRGTGLFVAGDMEVRLDEGQILVVPPFTPHKFSNAGPGALETIDIHLSKEFVTEWLE